MKSARGWHELEYSGPHSHHVTGYKPEESSFDTRQDTETYRFLQNIQTASGVYSTSLSMDIRDEAG